MIATMGLFRNLTTRPNIYLDVYLVSIKIGNKIRLKPLDGQSVPNYYFVECSRTLRKQYPIGTIYQSDVRLVQPKNRKPYLQTIHRNNLERAIDFLEHNIILQRSQII